MKGVRALLAFLWFAFALTASAHAGASPEPSCHMNPVPGTDMPSMDRPSMDMSGMSHHQSRHDDQAPMPCCSQPVVVAMPAPIVLTERQIERVRLTPAPASALVDHPLRIEPRPPKVV